MADSGPSVTKASVKAGELLNKLPPESPRTRPVRMCVGNAVTAWQLDLRSYIHNHSLITSQSRSPVVGDGEDDVNRARAGWHDPAGGYGEPRFGLVKVLNRNGLTSARI